MALDMKQSIGFSPSKELEDMITQFVWNGGEPSESEKMSISTKSWKRVKNSILDELMGVNEVAELLNVKPNLISTWAHREKMPRPDVLINAGKTQVWLRETIIEWAGETGKLPIDFEVNWKQRRSNAL